MHEWQTVSRALGREPRHYVDWVPDTAMTGVWNIGGDAQARAQ